MSVAYESAGFAPGLEELVAVARHQHVTRAAQQLGIPQPTLSRALARLADELGVPLLRREGRGVRLTRQGELLAGHAERALDELLSGLRAVRADADPDTGAVVLGFLHSLGPTVVPALLRSFRRTRPGVTVRLVQDGADELLAGTATGRIDLCVTSAQPPLPPRLRLRPLAEQALTLLVPADHSLATRPSVQLADARDEPLITMVPGYGLRTLTDALLRTAGLPVRYTYESQDLTTATGLVAAGLGLALIPEGNGVPGTVELPLREPHATRTLVLAWSRERPLLGPARALRDHITTEAPALLGLHPATDPPDDDRSSGASCSRRA
jgi:DNA-binding transcriptional LysR family regulator